MPHGRESLQPSETKLLRMRRRLGLKEEFLLAAAPTVVVMTVFALVEVLTEQRLLFASLASSAFLIYLDPEHGTNSARTLMVAQLSAAAFGYIAYALLGVGYLSGGLAMVALIVTMITFDVVHPPAVSTALSFAFRSGDASNLLIFALAVAITAALVLLERLALWLLSRLPR